VSEDVLLERRYRRLLALYPRAFRCDHEEEMLGVLLAGAGGRRYPGVAEVLDLFRSATWARFRPGVPRSEGTVFAGVRLMYVGAAVQLVGLLTLLLTLGSIKAAIERQDPAFTAAQWHAVVGAHIIPDTIGEPIAAVVWVWLAWANGRGRRWAPAVFAAFLAFTTLSILVSLGQGAVTYAPAATGVAGVLWLVGVAALVLLFHGRSGSYFGRSPSSASGSPWRDTLA
jgi:hypothetical protein